jgi:outer membrane protein X
MKKYLTRTAIAVIAVTMCVTAFAQEKGDKAVGANFVFGGSRYSSSTYTNIGVSGKARYNIFDAVRAEGELTFFLPKNNVTSLDLSLNGHYLLPISDAMTVYPLAGLGFYNSFYKNSGLSNYNDVCFNLGGGIDFNITDQLYFNVEAKFKIVNRYSYGNVMLVSAGIIYRF